MFTHPKEDDANMQIIVPKYSDSCVEIGVNLIHVNIELIF